MASPGIADLFFKDLRGRLESIDDGFVFEAQYSTTDLVENIAANYTEFRSLGRVQPVLMFDDEKSDTMTFTIRFFAQHNGLFGLFGDSIDDKVEQLRSLPRKVAELGRPRIFDFVIGESIGFRCVVETVGGISYDRLRPATGDLRGVTASIVLKRYEEYDVTLSGGNAAESVVQPFLSNDSYETLTKRVYGVALLGEALRRRNPDKAQPAVGTFVHIPPQAKLTKGFALTPQSPALATNEANDARRKTIFKTHRARRRLSFSLGAEWDGAQ